MNDQPEVEIVVVPSDTSSIPDPVWHLTYGSSKPGKVALCGAKMSGIDGGKFDSLKGVCEKCAKLWQGRRG